MAGRPAQDSDRRREQALRDLDRVQEQSETIGSSALKRSAERARDHVMGADADPDDRIEVWGRRIGRSAGLLFALALVYYLLVTYF